MSALDRAVLSELVAPGLNNNLSLTNSNLPKSAPLPNTQFARVLFWDFKILIYKIKKFI